MLDDGVGQTVVHALRSIRTQESWLKALRTSQPILHAVLNRYGMGRHRNAAGGRVPQRVFFLFLSSLHQLLNDSIIIFVLGAPPSPSLESLASALAR